MFKNRKKIFISGYLISLLTTTIVATSALSSCRANSSELIKPEEKFYETNIDWSDKNIINKLVSDENGLIYLDSTKTTIIALNPDAHSTIIKIPSSVKSIMGYTRTVYKTYDGIIYEDIPTDSYYTEEYKVYGAFQNIKTLTKIILDSDSQLDTIGKLAFYDCVSLQSIEDKTNNLKNIGENAFYNCSNLSTINLSNTLTIGENAFYNCSNLSSLGSLEKLTTIGKKAFYNAFKSDSNITLKFNNLISVADSAFAETKGISNVDFSNDVALAEIVDSAFINSKILTVDFSGCSKLFSINQRAFENCVDLVAVYLPNNDDSNLESIGWNAFAKCYKLTTVAPKGLTGFVATNKLSSIGANLLSNTSINSVNLYDFNINFDNNFNGVPLGSEFALAFIPNLKFVSLPRNIETLNAGLFYGSGLSENGGFSLDLPRSVSNIIYSSSIYIPDANNDDVNAKINLLSATPFTNSGIISIDMSEITSYQNSNTPYSVPDCLFQNNTKLVSVILKQYTTGIGIRSFAETTALTSITYSKSSNAITNSNITMGFKASSDLYTIGNDAFRGAFSETSNAIVDLSAMKITSAPAAFSFSNVKSLKLPETIRFIPSNSFDNMTKLSSVNFEDLFYLEQIVAPNFNKTQLTSIDLSRVRYTNTLFSGLNWNGGKIFTDLPTSCVVKMPNMDWYFNGAFTDVNSNLVSLSYPYGISSLVVNDVGAFHFNPVAGNAKIWKIRDINLEYSFIPFYSVGTDTFFGNTKLNSITLPALYISKGINSINSTGLFSSDKIITPNTSNTTKPINYTRYDVPFGNNAALKSLNYRSFTLNTNYSNGADKQETLFNRIKNKDTWDEIVKIINSFSYQYTNETNNVAAIKPNMSEWEPLNDVSSPINIDITSILSGNDIILTNLYDSVNDTISNNKNINANTTEMTFLHNGVTWKYKNDGKNITLTGAVNMYKLMDKSQKNYLVYFNQLANSSENLITKYIPGQAVNVTLTIASTPIDIIE